MAEVDDSGLMALICHISQHDEASVSEASASILANAIQQSAWLDQQRQTARAEGARLALMDFKRFLVRVVPRVTLHRDSLVADVNESLRRLEKTGHLLMGPLEPTDQIEQKQNDESV